jgi:hypothetical protein
MMEQMMMYQMMQMQQAYLMSMMQQNPNYQGAAQQNPYYQGGAQFQNTPLQTMTPYQATATQALHRQRAATGTSNGNGQTTSFRQSAGLRR